MSAGRAVAERGEALCGAAAPCPRLPARLGRGGGAWRPRPVLRPPQHRLGLSGLAAPRAAAEPAGRGLKAGTTELILCGLQSCFVTDVCGFCRSVPGPPGRVLVLVLRPSSDALQPVKTSQRCEITLAHKHVEANGERQRDFLTPNPYFCINKYIFIGALVLDYLTHRYTTVEIQFSGLEPYMFG